jgi:hypothetical protein
MAFNLQTFTLFHVLVSVVGIISGLVVAGGLAGGRRLGGWAALFLVTSVATSATGYFFPSDSVLPSHIVGAVALVVLAGVIVAQLKGLAGPWRRVYATGVVAATYFNCFVLMVQLFRRIPDLSALAPTQSEPPFAIAQILLLASFVWLGVAANTGIRSGVATKG